MENQNKYKQIGSYTFISMFRYYPYKYTLITIPFLNNHRSSTSHQVPWYQYRQKNLQTYKNKKGILQTRTS